MVKNTIIYFLDNKVKIIRKWESAFVAVLPLHGQGAQWHLMTGRMCAKVRLHLHAYNQKAE